MAFALAAPGGGGAGWAWAALRGWARRFLSWPDMISQILLVAMVLNVAAYVPSTLANANDLNAREFAVVLPFGWRSWRAGTLGGSASGTASAGGPGRPCWPARPALCWPEYGASLGWAARPAIGPRD